MKKIIPVFVIIFLFTLLLAAPGYAQQENQLTLGLSRDFGYGGLGNDIQGTFSAKIVNPPPDLVKVDFLIEGKLMVEDTQAPFIYQFNTDNYPLGLHTLSALGYTSTGAELHSNEISPNFVSAQEGWKAVLKIILPVLGLVIAAMLMAAFIPILTGRGKKLDTPLGAPRTYGVSGGTICPKCHRPFSLHLLTLHLLTYKLERCPYCGKWSLVRPYSRAALAAAEAAELEGSKPAGEMAEESEEERIRKELERSKYQDV